MTFISARHRAGRLPPAIALRDDPGLLFLRPAAAMAGPGEDLDPSDRPVSHGFVRWHHHGTKRLAIIVAQLFHPSALAR